MFWMIIVVCVAVDRLIKILVVNNMALGQSIPVIKNVLNITYIHNTGAAFSFLEGQRWAFIVITVIVLSAVIYAAHKIPRSYRRFRAAIALFTGGTIGNFIDRLVQGAVVDFIDVPFFAIFNFADCCLTVSVILICLMLICGREKRLLENKK